MRHYFFETAKKVFKPRPRITGTEWADTYRIVAAGTSSEPGPWRTSRVPYMREPLDMATAFKVERVVIMAASQVAKSELILNVMGYYADREPSPQLFLSPTVETVESFSKERINPTFESTPVLAELIGLVDDKGSSRKSDNTIRFKKYPGGYIAMVGTNSPAGLASRPIRVLLMDEIDRFGMTKEGKPVDLAIQRTQNFPNRKIVMVSTPTTKTRPEGPTIYEEYIKSDQREFMPLCPHCNKRYFLKWEGVKWDKDEAGKLIPESVRYECPHCHYKVRGPERPLPAQLASGVWVPQEPENKFPGYHMTALVSPWTRLVDLVEGFLLAVRTRDTEKMKAFVNLKLGEPWEEYKKEAAAWETLFKRREYYAKEGFSPSVLFLTAGVDVQRDRLECSVYGWGLGREAWLIAHHILRGDPTERGVWDALDTVLFKTKYYTSTEKPRVLVATFVDSGDGQTTDKVYQYTKARERYRVFSIKGRGGPAVPFIDKPHRVGAYEAWLYTLGVDAGKSIVTGRLALDTAGPGFIHFPRGDVTIDEEFFQQLTAETQRAVKQKNGVEKIEWVKIRDRNEALDCLVYATAAMESISPDFDKIKEQIGE